LRYFCALHHQDTALHPVITHLEHAASFSRDDPPAAKLEKLRRLFGQGRLGHLRRRVAAHAGQRSRNSEQETELSMLAVAGVRQALIADLLSLPTGNALSEMNLSPQRKKERTLESLLGLLEDLSRKRPVLMVFEDAHWIDPTSRELLDLTIERTRRLPVLLIITFRPEFSEAWRGAAHVSTLLLNRLDAGEGTELAETVAGKPLPSEVVANIADRTDGVPLFVEELTRAVVEGVCCATKATATLSTDQFPHSQSHRACTPRCWPGWTALARQRRKSRRSVLLSDASSPTSYWPQSRGAVRQSCKMRSVDSSMQV
jgi:predicted ATPase